MQTIQQYPECGERRYRDERFPDGTAGADRSVAHPRRDAAYGSIGKLAENVLACGEPCLSLLAKVEPVQWMPRVMNLDPFRTMGTMFLARAARGRAIWRQDYVWPLAAKSGRFASRLRRRWSTSWWTRNRTIRCGG
jgi:hypothetical protein